MRRIWLLSAVLLAAAPAAPQTPQGPKPAPTDPRPTPPASQQPPPIFRGGTNLVQVDAIVTDDNRQPVSDLAAADFEVLDDGKPVTIDRVRFLGAEAYSGDSTLAPIRTHEDEEREASRDDVRVYAIVLDDYHVTRMGELRVIEPLLAFVRQLPPTDLVAVYYPLDSVTDVAFSRDREPVMKAIRNFVGRQGDYTPKHPVEEEHWRYQRQIETIRRQIVTTALEGLTTHLGAIKQGRKSLIFVTEAFPEPVSETRELFEAANRANVAIYPLDPRGLSADPRVDRMSSPADIMALVLPPREYLRTLALETGGRPMFGNDVRADLGQAIRDSRAYYLIAYESPHPDDGKFHKVSVSVKRSRASVFARSGYWAFKRGENSGAPAAAPVAVPARVQAAIEQLADSLRPDAGEPADGRPRVMMPRPAAAPAAPTVAVVHGRTVGDPVARHEFRRTDTLAIRAGSSRTSAGGGRLLDRLGRPLTDLPLVAGTEVPELRLALGNLGPGDYVVELAEQYVAFRVVR